MAFIDAALNQEAQMGRAPSDGMRLAPALAVVLLTACATADPDLLSADESHFVSATGQFYRTVGVGAMVGAAGGAIVDGAIKGVKEGPAGVAVGAAVGLVVGVGVGLAVAIGNQQHAEREAAMSKRISDALSEVSHLRAIADLGAKVSLEEQSHLAELDERYRAGELAAADYRDAARTARAMNERLRQAIEEGMKLETRVTRGALRDAGGDGMASYGQAAAASIDKLRKSQADLAMALSAVPN